jgi:tRNA1Val (adenine37-N6)-methyltransferase
MNTPFQFKQFSVLQDQCAMKIGTDGVLLGAWTPLKNTPNSILDIGAGTGIIALQLAQRSQAQLIDALEIDENAYEQCVLNFENSPWNDRLFCYHASAQEFAEEIDDQTYDLIISNPPFFSEDNKPTNPQRNIARFQDALPFTHLLDCVTKLLTKKGVFSCIIPYKEEAYFVKLAAQQGLFINHICRVKGNPNTPYKRSLLSFSFKEITPHINSLVIETKRHVYTPEYKNLVCDFYLKM